MKIKQTYKKTLAKDYGLKHKTFFRQVKEIAKDPSNPLEIHNKHYFTIKEIEIIINELGNPYNEI